MPIESHILAQLFDDVFDEFDHLTRPIRRCVTNSVTNTDRTSSAANRGSVKRADGFRIGPGRVFGNEHHRQALVNRERYGLFGHP